MKALLLQAWHFLESGRRQRRCFRQAVLWKEQFGFCNANTKCLFFLPWAFHCEGIYKEHLAGFDMRPFFLSLFPFFCISPPILSMILLFLTVFSGASAPWEDKEAFQKAFPCPNPSEYKSNIDLFRRSQDCKRVFTQQTDPMTAVQWWDSGVTVVNTL